ncbi:MAG TPA: anaerobic sulfatase maturase [Spirochaetia bacterium]|nr:anaerobic sulfatase maturase [Spirochaetia bacterium]
MLIQVMRPFSLLVKPASADCNLECTYCFYLDRKQLYPEHHRHQMSTAVLEKMIKGYMATEQPQYTFGWQGGEPTLMGRSFFRKVTDLQERYGRPGATVTNGLQTNGTLITDELASHLAAYNFLVGISVDGPEEIHNRYRLKVGGNRGTHAEVIRGLELLRKHRVEFNVLTLVTAANVDHPGTVYRYLRDELGVFYHQYIPCVEFDAEGNLLPYSISAEQWGRFMNGIFDEWIGNNTRTVSVRHFDSILTMMVENQASVCTLGRDCRQYFVVEFNGDVYPCDFFVDPDKRLGNLMSDSWYDMWRSPKFREFGAQKRNWNAACTGCPYLAYCAGDCIKHRVAFPSPEPREDSLSRLCEGWKMFYGHTLDGFRNLADQVKKDRTRSILGM